MNMGCHAILQRLNLVPRGYIILDITQSFRRISGDFRENLRSFSLREILSPRKLDEKLDEKNMEIIINFRKNMMAQPSFYY